MSQFEGIERRVRRECEAMGAHKAQELRITIARTLGYNPGATWGFSEDFIKAIKPLENFAAKRFEELEMQRVWGDAEKAALDVLKQPTKEHS